MVEVGRLRDIAEITLRLRQDGELPKPEAIRLLGLMREELIDLAGSRELRIIVLIDHLMNLIEQLPIYNVPALERLAGKLPLCQAFFFLNARAQPTKILQPSLTEFLRVNLIFTI